MKPWIPALVLLAIQSSATAQSWGAEDVIAVQWSALVGAHEKCGYKPPVSVVSRAKTTMQSAWKDRWISIDEVVVSGVWSQMDLLQPTMKTAYCLYVDQRVADIAVRHLAAPAEMMPAEWLEAIKSRSR